MFAVAETLTLSRELLGETFVHTTPAIVRQQVHHSNYEVSTPEEYYRVSIYNEFLSHVVQELETRFTENMSTACYIFRVSVLLQLFQNLSFVQLICTRLTCRTVTCS